MEEEVLYANDQLERVQKFYDDIKEERVVTSKDVAFHWIISICEGYDGKRRQESLMLVIDEIMAYARLGMEQVEKP